MKLLVRGDEKSETIIAERKDLNIIKSLLECFHITRRLPNPNIIQLNIKYSDNKFERIIEVKATSGVSIFLTLA